MKKANYSFTILLFVALIYHLLLLFFDVHWFLHAYLDDTLFIPLLMGTALYVQRKWIVKNPKFTFKWYYTIWVWMYTFLVFELLFPQVNKAFTRDVLDGIAYAVGAAYFQLFVNKSDRAS